MSAGRDDFVRTAVRASPTASCCLGKLRALPWWADDGCLALAVGWRFLRNERPALPAESFVSYFSRLRIGACLSYIDIRDYLKHCHHPGDGEDPRKYIQSGYPEDDQVAFEGCFLQGFAIKIAVVFAPI